MVYRLYTDDTMDGWCWNLAAGKASVVTCVAITLLLLRAVMCNSVVSPVTSFRGQIRVTALS